MPYLVDYVLMIGLFLIMAFMTKVLILFCDVVEQECEDEYEEEFDDE